MPLALLFLLLANGGTWSLNMPSYSDGRLYHRGLKELIRIGKR
jgi:hypothetical protein